MESEEKEFTKGGNSFEEKRRERTEQGCRGKMDSTRCPAKIRGKIYFLANCRNKAPITRISPDSAPVIDCFHFGWHQIVVAVEAFPELEKDKGNREEENHNFRLIAHSSE